MCRSSVLVLGALCVAAGLGCGRGAAQATDIGVSWTLPASPTTHDVTIADVTLLDGTNQPVRGARMEVQAFMSHPGMAPIVATAVERPDGVYRTRLQFTMAGAWTIVIRGVLADGRTFTRQIDVPHVRSGA